MSKSTINKGHLQQKSLASKIWQQVKRHFHKPHHDDHTNPDISDAAVVAIQQELALIDEDLDIRQPQKNAAANKDYTEFEVEITLDELQDALHLLEKQNQTLSSADEALKELIDVLKKSEKTASSETEGETKKPEMEVVVEFIPLPSTPANASLESKTVYREVQLESMSDKIKREKEQRELAKRITHYPPSDRLH